MRLWLGERGLKGVCWVWVVRCKSADEYALRVVIWGAVYPADDGMVWSKGAIWTVELIQVLVR